MTGTILSEPFVNAVKSGLATLAFVLFVWGIAVSRAGRSQTDRRIRDRLLACLGIVSALAWYNFFSFHYPNYVHVWEHFHYYIGAKYAPELGDTRIYECTAVAEIEQGRRDLVLARTIRDLRENSIIETERVAAVARPGLCKTHFSAERWRAFKKDIAYFRGKMSLERWNEAQEDHGYNASPVWELLGHPLANLAPASDNTQLALGMLDALLLAGMWALVYWAFGWRGLCVALIFWGTNQTTRFFWNGGAFLRQDWLAATIAGICLVKRDMMRSGGFALTYATLLRVFPGLLIVALVLKALMRMIRERKLALSTEHRRFAEGCVGALVLLLALSAVMPGNSWPGFVDNSRKHLATYATNHLGLKTVLSYEHSSRGEIENDASLLEPWSEWKNARRSTFERRRWVYAVLVLTLVILIARAVVDQDDWVALILGIGLIPIATYLACYYYSILLGYGLLWEKTENRIGASLCALAWVTYLMAESWAWWDQLYTGTSVVVLVFVIWVTTGFVLGREPQRESRKTDPRSSAGPAETPWSLAGARRSSP